MGYDVFFNCMNTENKPERKKGGWFDIPLPYNVSYKAGEVVKLVFDLRVKMPIGYEGIIQPRSSTLEKTGLISSGFGVIEDSYCGEDDYIGYRFYATRDGFVSAGSCLVQMRFQKKMEGCFARMMSDSFFTGVESRGGFGSTDTSESFDGTKEDLAKKAKTLLSNTYGKTCTGTPEQESEYQQGFSTGFDEGHMDGYEEGFRDGYDRCTDDLKMNFTNNYESLKLKSASMYGKTCTENEDFDQLVKVNKRDYELGFLHGFDAGYDRAIEDLRLRLSRGCATNG